MDDVQAELRELRKRVARLEARNDIVELVTAYAVACDQHDMPGLMALFTEDAAFASPGGAMDAVGQGAIEAMFIELFKIRGPAYHWTHDVCVDVHESGNTASGAVYSHAETTPNGVVSLAAMRYADDYVREDGAWKFARREISFLYYVPATEYANALNQVDRVTVSDGRKQADYPESLPSWQAFDKRYGGLG